MSIAKFLKNNKDRAMQLAVRENDAGEIVENRGLACIDTHIHPSFKRWLRYYQRKPHFSRLNTCERT